MKGFIAAVLATLPTIVQRDLRRPLAIALSGDEEIGLQGVGTLLDVLAEEARRPAFCIVGEPTGMRVAVAHKGKVAFLIRLNGRAVHSSAAPDGVSAIASAGEMIGASLNVGCIHGGTGVNIVADECTLDVEIRALPHHDPATLLQPIMALSEEIQANMRVRAPEAAVTVEIQAKYPGLYEGGDIGSFVAELADSDHGLAVDFGTEAGLYKQRLGVPVVVCGPGDVAQAHTVDEFIEEEQLIRAEQFVHRLADWLCADAQVSPPS
jgi:acetylornithine deacetylase